MWVKGGTAKGRAKISSENISLGIFFPKFIWEFLQPFSSAKPGLPSTLLSPDYSLVETKQQIEEALREQKTVKIENKQDYQVQPWRELKEMDRQFWRGVTQTFNQQTQTDL